MTIKISERDHLLAKWVAIIKSYSVGCTDTKNSQNFFEGKEHLYRSYLGMLGEVGFARYSGLKMNIDTIGVGDDGTDFEYGIQVKCSDSRNKPNLMFPVTQYKRKHAEYYILTWYKNQMLEFVGYTTRGYIDNNHKIKNYGYGDTVFVSHNELKPIQSLEILETMPRKQQYKQPTVNTQEEHYKAFKWCDENNIRIYPKPRDGKFILVYTVDGVAHTTNKLHDPKNYQQAIWDFYLFLYNKLNNDPN